MHFISLCSILIAVFPMVKNQQSRHSCKKVDPTNAECLQDINKCSNVTCEEDDNHCMTVYKLEKGRFVPFFGGCFGTPHDQSTTSHNKCVLYQRNPHYPTHYDCFCSGSFCNANIIFPQIKSTTEQPVRNTTKALSSLQPTQRTDSSEKLYLYYIPASIFLMTMVLGVALFFWIKRKRRRRNSHETLLTEFNTTMTQPKTYPASFLEIIHQGQMNTIWKATFCQRAAAIKIVNKLDVTQWVNEKDIFLNHKLKHDNVVNFISAERRFKETTVQYWIVTEYHEKGSLANYLLKNILSKETFLRMLYSTVKGLVYLHSNSKMKPMVAHRDLKPANVLVKADLSCCICDLGLALPLPENIDVSRELCQAGTKRYMAPEILQGAVTFYQESFLRADMYSMGLLFWDLLSRTKIDESIEVEEYKPPYSGLVNFNPSVDEMLKCVVENHKRPHIPNHWKETQSFVTIVETMELCWDDDADARLTSQCVAQRIRRLIHSPPDNTFQSHALEQLKEGEKENSQSSSISSNSALLWDNSSTRKDCTSNKSIGSYSTTDDHSQYSLSSSSNTVLTKCNA
eukprot:TCONS_00026127-protein